MGYVFGDQDARRYAEWLREPRNRLVFDIESRLMVDLIQPARGETVLDIGCGTGESLRPFVEKGLQGTGLDPSPPMLDRAYRNFRNEVDLYRGFAEELPFDDNSFHYATFFTTLEFVEDPVKAIAEASRVAKDRIFIGVLNRYALETLPRKMKGLFAPSFHSRAKPYGVWELKGLTRRLLGPAPVVWRTVCLFPPRTEQFLFSLEHGRILQRCPFGTFLGMAVTLVPRLRTRPLAIRYRPGHPSRALTELPAPRGISSADAGP